MRTVRADGRSDRPRCGGGQPSRRSHRRDRRQHPRHHRAQGSSSSGSATSTGARPPSSSRWPTGVMIVDADGTVVRVNEAFEVHVRGAPGAVDRPPSRTSGRGRTRRGRARSTSRARRSSDRRPPDHDQASGVAAARSGWCSACSAAAGSPDVGPDQRPGHGRRATARSPARWPRSATSPRPASRRPSSVGRSSSSRSCLDTLEEGIVACDAEGRITVFNPAARQLHGLDDGRRADRDRSPPTRGSGDPTASPWPNGRTR